jgi:hypothetical protein
VEALEDFNPALQLIPPLPRQPGCLHHQTR